MFSAFLRRRDPYVLLLFVTALLAMTALAILVPDRFLHADNFASMAIQMSELGLYAVAMTLSLIIGGIDLSIVAVANLAAILSALTVGALVPEGANVWVAAGGFIAALLVSLAVGLVVGAVNGLLIARLGVPAILATLGTMTFFSGVAFGVTGGSAISGLPDRLAGIGNATVAGVPVLFLVFLAVWWLADLLVRRTAFGAEMILVGTSFRVARFSGIATRRVVVGTHLATALIAAVAGFSSLMRTNSANADYGGTYVLLAILVSVLGGVSVTGGAGRLVGVLWALVILQLLSTGFNMLLLFVSDGNFFRDFAWGFLLLLIMSLTSGLKARR
jgi:simple sugar transport system permease protein